MPLGGMTLAVSCTQDLVVQVLFSRQTSASGARVRQKAEALQDMVAPKLMRAALTCDYSSECLAFLL